MEHISETLEALSNSATSRKANKRLQCLRGVRGTPVGEIARVADATWREEPPRLPQSSDALDQLFGAAWEDGLVAIVLLAACLTDNPAEALDMGLDWASRLDDFESADALGWLVLGPAAVLTGGLSPLYRLKDHHRPEVRRAALMAGMALTPTVVTGPSAAPLRAKLKERRVRMVEASVSHLLGPHCDRFVRDDAPVVRKALRRVLRGWSEDAPEGVVAWGESIKGGLPRLLKTEIDRARRRVA